MAYIRLGARRAATMTIGFLLAVVLAVSMLPGAVARADSPLFLGWTALLPPLLDQYTTEEATECAAGAPGCVDATIAHMSNRFSPLATSCDHRAIFSLAYLRTTQTYKTAAAQAGFFADTPYVNTEDAVFAAYYFRAYDDWAAGRTAAVPKAWQIAFSAATSKAVSGAGDLLLGMNAHVNRDLPFVLASLGLVTPDGQSRKPDHDKVNVFLNWVVSPLLAEIAARFDPSVDDLDTPYGLSWTALMQILETWREAAWRNAELLVAAPDAAARAVVAQTIETSAAATATTIRASYSYVPLLVTTASRDAYCAAHHG